MAGNALSVEQAVGRSGGLVDGCSDHAYGKCYGQVCGRSYPCTQRTVEDEESALPSKEEYRRKRRAHNSKQVRCVETGEVFGSFRDAAKRVGMSDTQFGVRVNSGKPIGGMHYEVVSDAG